MLTDVLRRIRPRAAGGIDVEKFWRDGYAIVPGVYSDADVDRFRAGVTASTGPKTDLLANPHLHSVLTDGNLVEIAREILGTTDDLLYAGDSSFTVGNQQRGYHKDNADRLDGAAPDWHGRYSVLRFGVYLQDHRWHTGGLNLRVGSHEHANLTEGKHIYVRSRPGDVVVWSLRTSHSGNGDSLRFPWWKFPEVKADEPLPKWYLPATQDRDERMALFAAIGLDDAHHERYNTYLKTREYIVNMWKRTEYSASVLNEAAKAGLRVRNMPDEVADDPTAGQNVTWKAIPYEASSSG